jgi:xylan 1,4-beta-xylosidase
MLGRETAIQRVEWTDDGWLALAGGGTVARLETPGPADGGGKPEPVRDDFDGPAIDPRLSTLRRPLAEDWAGLSIRPGSLTLRGGDMLTSRFDVSLVATQLQDVDAVAETRVAVRPRHFSHSAGLVVMYDERNFAYLRRYRSESLDADAVGIILMEDGAKRELLLDRAAVDTDEVVLQARLEHGTLRFAWGTAPGELREIGPVLDATFMSDEATRGFTGTVVGLACVDAYRKDLLAHFDWFDLRHGHAALTSPPARAVTASSSGGAAGADGSPQAAVDIRAPASDHA